MIRNIVGNVPDPEELIGREDFISHLWRQIEGNNILLLAPRRFGKTGIMEHVRQRPQPGYLPVYFNLEDVDSPEEFLWRATEAVLQQDSLRHALATAGRLPGFLMGWIKDQFDEVAFEGAKLTFKASAAKDWRQTAKSFFLALEKADDTIVFIFDELPSMLDTICRERDEDAAKDFLAWFRSARISGKDKLRRHRFIVGGSTGIDLALRRLKSEDKLNDFERLAVEPIAETEAKQLIAGLAQTMKVELAPEGADQMLALIGQPVPYFIHMLFSQLGQLPAAKRQPLTAATLDDVYRKRVIGPTCKHYFDHYQSRLRQYGGLESAARRTLKAIVEAPRGRISRSELYGVYRKPPRKGTSENEFSEMMADLECDWYLSLDPDTNEYFFRINIVRDWWQRWYGSPSDGKKGA